MERIAGLAAASLSLLVVFGYLGLTVLNQKTSIRLNILAVVAFIAVTAHLVYGVLSNYQPSFLAVLVGCGAIMIYLFEADDLKHRIAYPKK